MQLVTRRTKTEPKFQKKSYDGEQGKKHRHEETGDCCSLCNFRFQGRILYLEGRLHQWRGTDDLATHLTQCLETWLPRRDIFHRTKKQKVAVWAVSVNLPRTPAARDSPYTPRRNEPCWLFRAVVVLPVEVDWDRPWVKALSARGQPPFAMYGLENLEFSAPFRTDQDEFFWEWTRRRITGEEENPNGFTSSGHLGDLARVVKALGIPESQASHLRQIPIEINGELQQVEPDNAVVDLNQRLSNRSLAANTLPQYEALEIPPPYTP